MEMEKQEMKVRDDEKQEKNELFLKYFTFFS